MEILNFMADTAPELCLKVSAFPIGSSSICVNSRKTQLEKYYIGLANQPYQGLWIKGWTLPWREERRSQRNLW